MELTFSVLQWFAIPCFFAFENFSTIELDGVTATAATQVAVEIEAEVCRI